MPTYVAPSCNGPTVQEDQDTSAGVPLSVASAGVIPSGGQVHHTATFYLFFIFLCH